MKEYTKEDIQAENAKIQAKLKLLEAVKTMGYYSIEDIANAVQSVHSYKLNRIVHGMLKVVKNRPDDPRLALVLRELATQYY